MLIKGTSKIKGALDLSGINQQLTSGMEVSVSDDQFYKHSIQSAIKMGFLTYRPGSFNIKLEGSKHIKLKNILERSITVNALEANIRPGETFTLTEEQVNQGDIRAALSKGMFKIISSVKAQPIKETTVKIGDPFTENKENIKEADTIQNLDMLDTVGKDKEDNYLETNEEASIPTIEDSEIKTVEMKNIIDTENPKPVSGTINDPKRKSVVWNPNKDPVVETLGKMDSVSVSKDSKEHSPISEENVNIPDIMFVDQEMDAKKRASHPKLKNNPSENNNELDFV